jgi:hypothetical protein
MVMRYKPCFPGAGVVQRDVAGDVLLCKDLSNAQITGNVMAQWYLDNEAKIVKTALRAKGPYVMAVNPSYGLRRARLAYPPD